MGVPLYALVVYVRIAAERTGQMLILSLAGLFHAYKTPRSKGFALPDPVANRTQKVLVNA